MEKDVPSSAGAKRTLAKAVSPSDCSLAVLPIGVRRIAALAAAIFVLLGLAILAPTSAQADDAAKANYVGAAA